MSAILQKQVGIGVAVTIVTTAETLICYSGRVEANLGTLRSVIRGWLQIAMSAASTTLTLRIRRGNGIAGAVVAGGNAENVVASNTDDFNITFAEQLLNVEFADYSLTAQMAGANANSTVNLSMIEVEFING